MSEMEKRIVETFSKVIPTMTEPEKERLLSFGEGMAFLAVQRSQPSIQQAQAS